MNNISALDNPLGVDRPLNQTNSILGPIYELNRIIIRCLKSYNCSPNNDNY